MKKYTYLKRFSIKPYSATFHQELCDMFLQFQKKNKIGHYHNLKKTHSDHFYNMYLINEFSSLIKKTQIKYVAIDEDSGKVFGCALFSVRGDSIQLELAFKKEGYIFNSVMKRCFSQALKEIVENKKPKEIFCVLGQREKFNSYIKFVLRTFAIKKCKQCEFNKFIVRFYENY